MAVMKRVDVEGIERRNSLPLEDNLKAFMWGTVNGGFDVTIKKDQSDHTYLGLVVSPHDSFTLAVWEFSEGN